MNTYKEAIKALAFDNNNTLLMPELLRLKQSLEKAPVDIHTPHIPNAVDRTPYNDPAKQKDLMDRLQESMRKMHVNVVNNLKDYIDNSGFTLEKNPVKRDPAATILAHIIMNIGTNKVLAYEKKSMDSFLKLLTVFALLKHDQQAKPELAAKAAQWYTDAQPLFTEMKMPSIVKNNQLQYMVNHFVKNKWDKKTSLQYPKYTKELRDYIHNDSFHPSKAKRNFFHAESKERRTYLTSLLGYYNSGSENYYRNIVNNVGILKEPLFNSEVEPEAKVPLDDAIKDLKAHTKKHGGTGLTLTTEQEIKLKAKNPEAHKEYRKHYLAVGHGRKIAIKNMVRKSGQDKLPVEVIKTGLKELGLPIDFIPVGFNGYYDEDSNMYAKNGLQLSNNIVGGTYEINRTYNPKKHGHQYIATHHNPHAKVPQKVYTLEHKKVSAEGIRHAVEHNTENLPEYRDNWRHDMQTATNPKKAIAHLVEAIYQTSSRPGSRDEGGLTDGKPTYGMRTLLRKHIKENPKTGGVVIKFPGKAGMVQEYKINPDDEHKKRLVNYLKLKMKNKEPHHPLWTIGASLTDRPSASDVTNYMKEMGWAKGLHKMRHMKGNELAIAYMKKHKPKEKMTAKEANDYINNLGMEVGKELGHQRSKKIEKDGKITTITEPTHLTALKSYIDPQLSADFFRSKGIPYPNWLEAAMKNKKTEEKE